MDYEIVDETDVILFMPIDESVGIAHGGMNVQEVNDGSDDESIG